MTINLITKAVEYLKRNPERFDQKEKDDFNNSFKNFLCGEFVLAVDLRFFNC